MCKLTLWKGKKMDTSMCTREDKKENKYRNPMKIKPFRIH